MTFARICLLYSIVIFPAILFAQSPQGKFTVEDYERALWMTTRFYGAQRSGEGPNWLLMERDTVEYRTSFMDMDGSRDLAGGWFDCGDHVTFGQTYFFSAYLLAKAYDLFPLGFHDYYHGFDYRDYMSTGNWDRGGGAPDGIPDLLQELKYATDWIIKATPDGSTFYYQKGEGAKDHKLWVTAGKMSKLSSDSGGAPRKIYKNPDDGVMASLAAATLSVMSRIYRKYDEEYADKCLEHAKYAYTYGKAHKESGAGAGDGGFYGAPKSPLMAFIVGASEMYASTGEDGYKNDAGSVQDKIEFHNWGFDYSNTHDLAPLAMATAKVDEQKIDLLKSMFLDQYTNSLNNEGVCTKGNSSWGALRYPGNHAFLAAAWAQVKQDSSLNDFIFKQADYIMGNNDAKQSFIVGFCSGCSKQVRLPHHRNVYLRDDNPNDSAKASMTIPARNEQFGYLVGGTWSSSSYKESVTDYAMTEGGIDYNAGLVGTLGYIVSLLDPADTANMVGTRYPGISNRNRAGGKVTVIPTGTGWKLNAPAGLQIVNAAVFDRLGRMVYNGAASAALARRGLPCGILTLRARCGNGNTETAQICNLR